MVRNYIRKTQRQSWDKQDMANAIRAVADGRMGYRKASKAFCVPRTTLERRVKMFKATPDTESATKKGLGKFTPVFNQEQEEELVSYLINMENRLDGLTTKELRVLVYQFAEKHKITHSFTNGMAGVDWVERFRNRNPNLLIRKPEPSTIARVIGLNRVIENNFYNLLEQTLESYNVTNENIYDVDDSNSVILCDEND